jgi:hypothetical protein
MTKYLFLYRACPTAPWPTDPADLLKVNEMLWGLMDLAIGTGQVKDAGWFLDGNSGYVIAEADSASALQATLASSPYLDWTMIEEVVPFEEGKKIFREDLKAKAEAMKQ